MVDSHRDDYSSNLESSVIIEHWCIGKIMWEERCRTCQAYNDGYVCNMPENFRLKVPQKVYDKVQTILDKLGNEL